MENEIDDGFGEFDSLLSEDTSLSYGDSNVKTEFQKFENECITELKNLVTSTLENENGEMFIKHLRLQDYHGMDLTYGGIKDETLIVSEDFFGLKYFTLQDFTSRKVQFHPSKITNVDINLQSKLATFSFSDKLFIKSMRVVNGNNRILESEPFYSCFHLAVEFTSHSQLKKLYSFIYNNFLEYLSPYDNTNKINRDNTYVGGFIKRSNYHRHIYLGVHHERHARNISQEVIVNKLFNPKAEKSKKFAKMSRKLDELSMSLVQLQKQKNDSGPPKREDEEECIEILPTSPLLNDDINDYEIISNNGDERIIKVKERKLSNIECVNSIKKTYKKFHVTLDSSVLQFVDCCKQYIEKTHVFILKENLRVGLFDLSMELITCIINNRISPTIRKYINEPINIIFDHPKFETNEMTKKEWICILEVLDKHTKVIDFSKQLKKNIDLYDVNIYDEMVKNSRKKNNKPKSLKREQRKLRQMKNEYVFLRKVKSKSKLKSKLKSKVKVKVKGKKRKKKYKVNKWKTKEEETTVSSVHIKKTTKQTKLEREMKNITIKTIQNDKVEIIELTKKSEKITTMETQTAGRRRRKRKRIGGWNVWKKFFKKIAMCYGK